MDRHSLGEAVESLKQCFLPQLRNLSVDESNVEMSGQQVHFYNELHSVEKSVVDIVTSLRKLVKSDSDLSPGNNCIIPQASCSHPIYTRTGANVSARPHRDS